MSATGFTPLLRRMVARLPAGAQHELRRVAIEPVPETFALLAANARLFKYANVSLLNFAASDGPGTAAMEVPIFTAGQPNYYKAHLVQAGLP